MKRKEKKRLEKIRIKKLQEFYKTREKLNKEKIEIKLKPKILIEPIKKDNWIIKLWKKITLKNLRK